MASTESMKPTLLHTTHAYCSQSGAPAGAHASQLRNQPTPVWHLTRASAAAARGSEHTHALTRGDSSSPRHTLGGVVGCCGRSAAHSQTPLFLGNIRRRGRGRLAAAAAAERVRPTGSGGGRGDACGAARQRRRRSQAPHSGVSVMRELHDVQASSAQVAGFGQLATPSLPPCTALWPREDLLHRSGSEAHQESGRWPAERRCEHGAPSRRPS